MRGVCLFVMVALSTVLNHVQSQSIVHIENSRFMQREEGLSGNVDVGLNFVQAVNFIFNTSNNSQLQFAKNNHSIMSVNGLNLTVVNKTKPVNDGFQHFRYNYKFNDFISSEVYIQGQYNHNTRIRGRYLAGMGVLLKIFETTRDSVQLFTGIHYMPEYEEEMLGAINRHHRMNSMISFGWPFRNQSKFEMVMYLQPDIAKLTDFRLSSQMAYEIPLLKKLVFRISMALFYDSYPPEGLKTFFFSARNSIKYKF
jgi:hypothetical protein